MHPSPRSARGFTIVEMSVVLVVIALLVGAVTVGRDVYRNAAAERMTHDFVQGWLLAYDRFVGGRGTVPGDDFDVPSGQVNNGLNNFLCDDPLLNAMLGAGVELPEGRGEGMADRYVHMDARGQPHQARVCFGNVQWSEPGATVGAYVLRPRNVMRIEGLTPALATMLDAKIDGRVDARHGRVREVNEHNNTSSIADPWSIDETQNFNGGTANPDAQTAEVVAYVRMSQ